MTRSPKITVVVPALNEAKNLREVLPELPPVHEVIVVDGRSVDDTVAAAQEVLPDVRVLTQSRKGKGNALVRGFEAATGDIIVMFDADGSADPAEIPAFVDALVAGADFAKGTRFRSTATARGGSEDITPLRHMGNAGLNGLANLLYGTRYSDLCYGYNAFWRHILPTLRLPAATADHLAADRLHWGDGFEIESVLSCRVGAARLKVTEVPSVERRRIHGETNLRTFADGFRVLRTLTFERFGRRAEGPIAEGQQTESSGSPSPALRSADDTAA